jgi:molybdenum cofactor cytidylyltransferase
VLVPAIVLSGGDSSRMGRAKALLEIAGETFLARVVRTLRAGGADDVVVVTGAHDAAIVRALLSDEIRVGPVRVVRNPTPERGQLSSLVTGLDVVDRPGVAAVLVTLVDVPLVRPATVAALLAAWRSSRAPVVRPRFEKRHGHPVVFDRAVFDELRAAPLDEGARTVVHRLGRAVIAVDTDDEGVCLDIDTPEDYASLVARFEPRR